MISPTEALYESHDCLYIYEKKDYNQHTVTDQKDPCPKIKADDLDTIITFLDDLRGSSSVGGSMVTSDDLGRWSRGAGGASGSTSSS